MGTTQKEFGASLTIRLLQQEKELLEQVAKQSGKTVSQLLRSTIVAISQNKSTVNSDNELSRKSFLAATNVRAIFKSLCGECNDLIRITKQQISLNNEEILHKDFLEIQYVLADIQKALNEYLSDFKVKEIHAVTRPSSNEKNQEPASLPADQQPQVRIKVTGKIVAEPKAFTSKSGAPMYKIRICQESVKGNVSYYSVYGLYDEEIISRYHTDDNVSLEGDFDIYPYEKDGRSVIAYRIFNPIFES